MENSKENMHFHTKALRVKCAAHAPETRGTFLESPQKPSVKI